MNIVSAPERKTAVIFLSMDDVMIGGRITILSERIQAKAEELFKKKEGLDGGFTRLEWRIAASHFLSPIALENLRRLIDKVNQTFNVAIVISSGWGLEGTVEKLKKKVFGIHFFGQYIVGKSAVQYPEERGEQINIWLRENFEKLNVGSMVILDSRARSNSAYFPNNFVFVRQGILSESDADLAFKLLTEHPFSRETFPTGSEVSQRLTESGHQCAIQ